jgi:ubiquinone/menaquinone biosynthesis C-methylase UbiE
MNTQDSTPVCDYEGSDYQASFWEKGGRAYEDRSEAIALKRLLPAAGCMLLEVGAGAGRNTPRYNGFEHVVLVDYSISQLTQARERLGREDRYTYVAANAYHLPFRDGLFDAATMIRTLHHMQDAPRALAQVRGVLQPNASFILEYANKRNIKSILRFWSRRQTWSPFTLEPVEFARLNFDFHPTAIRGWMSELGFSIDKTLTVSHFRVNLLKRAIPLGWLAGLDGLLQWTGALWQLSPSVFVRGRLLGESELDIPEDRTLWFKCPLCSHVPLKAGPNLLHCPACASQWAVENGIYNFREPLSGA